MPYLCLSLRLSDHATGNGDGDLAPTLKTGLRQTLEALCQAAEMQLGEI